MNIDSTYITNQLKDNKKIIGIGETGLDFYYNHSDKETQKKSFIQHINAALELDIPIIVHSRNAEIETLDILKSEKKNSNLKALIHCFTGSKDFAKKLIDIAVSCGADCVKFQKRTVSDVFTKNVLEYKHF